MLIPAPFGNYRHAVELPQGRRLVTLSGQLGVDASGVAPDGAEAQADQCFANIAAILAQEGLGPEDIIHLRAYVTRREDMAAYMRARDRFVANPPPASTLMIVSGFTRAEFLVEVEALAAAPI